MSVADPVYQWEPRGILGMLMLMMMLIMLILLFITMIMIMPTITFSSNVLNILPIMFIVTFGNSLEYKRPCLCQVRFWHDDVIKWKHFPRQWPFVRGIHRSPVNCPHKGQWRRALMFSLICAWMNGWVNNREARDLRRHRADHDVTIMGLSSSSGLCVRVSVRWYRSSTRTYQDAMPWIWLK